MKAVRDTATMLTARTMPATALAAAAALSLGAYAGYAARSAPPRHKPAFTLGASPAHDTISAGSTAGYRIRVHRKRFPWRIRFKVASQLPAGAAVHFTPRRTLGSFVTLTVRTKAWTALGTYYLWVRARHGRVVKRTRLSLTIAGPSSGGGTAGVALPRFSITGNVGAPLYPGQPQSIDFQITNPNPAPLLVSSFDTTIRSIRAPRATPQLACTMADFWVRQYSGPTPLSVPAWGSRSLQQLGVPAADWPQIAIIDRPADQDGCQGALLSLAYGGVASLG